MGGSLKISLSNGWFSILKIPFVHGEFFSMLVLVMCERYKNISFLYYCDVIEMIVRTTKNNIKIEQEQEVNSFLRL